ncbi:MAG: hypothetical protein ABF755_00910 [Oenococcus oeni]
MSSETMLTLTTVCKKYFGKKQPSLSKYEYFLQIPHIKIGKRLYWQVKDIDKYLERNKQ